jgi:hypothetical protein
MSDEKVVGMGLVPLKMEWWPWWVNRPGVHLPSMVLRVGATGGTKHIQPKTSVKGFIPSVFLWIDFSSQLNLNMDSVARSSLRLGEKLFHGIHGTKREPLLGSGFGCCWRSR